MAEITVAALFVERGGVYWDLPGVDPWDDERDARKYAGPWPVVAHPPCERWGRYANGGLGFRGAVRPIPGDDDGCFAAALAAVRRWGGVLEHPEGSSAFAAHGISAPPRWGSWQPAHDGYGGAIICVEQGHYGHPARKATWLYSVGTVTPVLHWGASERQLLRPEPGRRATRTGVCQNLSRKQRRATPPAFRDLLLSIARSAQPSDEKGSGR